MTLSEEDVRAIMRIIDETPFAEIHIETDGFEVHVVRAGGGGESSSSSRGRAVEKEDLSPSAHLHTVTAPMIGVFYAAEAPGEAPFVEPGSRVQANSTVCIIEVMKMMNSVPAGIAGTVVEVCQENGQTVEEGTPLFRIAPG